VKRSFLAITLSVLILSISRSANAQLKPRTEKHNIPATISADSTNQNNQAALYAALIKALNAITHQEEAAAEQKRTENKSWLTPLRVQKGLLIVGILYSVFAWFQWRAIKQQGVSLETIEKPYVSINFSPKHFPPPLNIPSEIEYWCENAGRTPASLKEFAADLCFALSLPAVPQYGRFTAYPNEFVVIGPNGGKSRPGSLFHRPTANERQQFLAGEATWFFYGYFRYTGFYGPDDVVGYAFRFDPKMGGFTLVEEAQYTYRRKYKRNQPTGLSNAEIGK
jgi:hypothetical protein